MISMEAFSEEKIDYLLDLLTLLLGERRGAEADEELTGDERTLLAQACRQVYASHSRPEGPYMRDLHAWLLEHQGDDPLCARLARRMQEYVGTGTYARLLDGPTTVTPDAPLEVFNFAGVSDKIAARAMLPLIEHLWGVIGTPDRPTLLVMDEGWSLLQGKASARFMREATRTGRHHGLLTLNISQFVTDYDNPLGRAILDSRSVALLLKQNPSQIKQIAELFELTEDEAEALARLNTIKRHRAGAYLHSGDGAGSGSLGIYHTPEQYWLFTSYKPERELRERTIERHGGDVWAAVQELARTQGQPDITPSSTPRDQDKQPTLTVVR